MQKKEELEDYIISHYKDCSGAQIANSLGLSRGYVNSIARKLGLKHSDTFMKRKSHIGKRYGKLVVLRLVASNDTKSRLFECQCDCGNKKIISESGLYKTQSCGCLAKKVALTKGSHRDSKSILYKKWRNMKARCYNQNAKQYQYYGGRGIKVCNEWRYDYSLFKEWAIKNGYNQNLSLERIDCNGDYCPENCTWIPLVKQSSKKRRNHNILYEGKLWSVSQIAEHFGVHRRTILRHLKNNDWGMRDVNYDEKSNYQQKI